MYTSDPYTNQNPNVQTRTPVIDAAYYSNLVYCDNESVWKLGSYQWIEIGKYTSYTSTIHLIGGSISYVEVNHLNRTIQLHGSENLPKIPYFETRNYEFPFFYYKDDLYYSVDYNSYKSLKGHTFRISNGGLFIDEKYYHSEQDIHSIHSICNDRFVFNISQYK